MVSIPLIFLAVSFLAVGRLQIRRARRLGDRRLFRTWSGWMLCIAGLLLMVLGVLLW